MSVAPSVDVRLIVDAFLAEPKTLQGHALWQPVGDSGKFMYIRPVQWRGENAGELQLKAYPRRPQPCFRIVMLMGRVIWRLDYAFHDDPHINSGNRPDDLPAGPIVGPHFHSWADNRMLAAKNGLPIRLRNARLLPDSVRTFEQSFWWFCDAINIDLSTVDVPDLPRSDRLV